MADYRFKRQRRIGAVELGLSGVTLAAERTSNKVDMAGNDGLTLFVNLSARTTTTRVDVAVDVSFDDPTASSPTWCPTQSDSIAAGAATMSDLVFQKTVSGTDTWECRLINMNCRMARVRVVSGAGGAAAGDVVSIDAIASYHE